jgi:hypothetical protein
MGSLQHSSETVSPEKTWKVARYASQIVLETAPFYFKSCQTFLELTEEPLLQSTATTDVHTNQDSPHASSMF